MANLQPHADTPMLLRIARIHDAAQGIRSLEFEQPDGSELPPFTPGSHIKVQVPNGLLRKYSLCNDASERHRYVIAVKRDALGQGGSMSLCDDAKEGDLIPVGVPDNAFALVDNAKAYVFIAGGIGITPILSMIRSFGELSNAKWKLYYFTRSPETTAFLKELQAPEFKDKVKIHHDFGDPAKAFDLWPVLERPGDTHVYCCGPRGLMEAVRDMSGHWPATKMHFESFNEGGEVRADDKPFDVVLKGTGKRFQVPVGVSILNVLRQHGCNVPSSCESGTCGTCRTTLVSGEADHRDMVLLPEDLAHQVMICVSRAKSTELVIDL